MIAGIQLTQSALSLRQSKNICLRFQRICLQGVQFLQVIGIPDYVALFCGFQLRRVTASIYLKTSSHPRPVRNEEYAHL